MAETVITGLAAIQQLKKEQEERAAAANRPKAEWFKWPKNVNVATMRILQEFDPSGSGYREDRGLVVTAVEHQAPGKEGYKRRGLCTHDTEGQCFPCEQHALRIEEDKGGWRQRTNTYFNALVDFGDGDKKVLVVSRPFANSFTQALIEEAVDEGSITDCNFKVTRTGEGTSTTWLLKRLKGDPFDDSDVEVFDLNETALRTIPYEKQAEYYGAVYEREGAAPAAKSTVSSDDDEW